MSKITYGHISSKRIATIGASAVGVSYVSSLYNNPEFALTLPNIKPYAEGQAKYTVLDKSTNRANWLNDETLGQLKPPPARPACLPDNRFGTHNSPIPTVPEASINYNTAQIRQKNLWT